MSSVFQYVEYNVYFKKFVLCLIMHVAVYKYMHRKTHYHGSQTVFITWTWSNSCELPKVGAGTELDLGLLIEQKMFLKLS